ncbi:histidine triad nucleotide-binding protein [Syntrophomonas wolfei]|uniref:histidine triad nucleotide-binding protein n=1 Tax=Syntrophomonas wolfei TaxID=863 RepID=UPI000A5E9615|nr:histidine triad nucleotide-binding protein [Syntrophomonas wolfei]
MNKSDCLFCKIVNREIPAELVYEDERIVAIKDINPAAPVHILLIPREHIVSLDQASNENVELLGCIQTTAAKLARELGIADKGYRLVNNCGEWGGQSVLHLHYHLLGGRQLAWPPG